MREKILLLLLLFPFMVSAKKAPKWKPGTMKVDADGISYSVKKHSNADSLSPGDYVQYWLFVYDYKTKKYAKDLSPSGVMVGKNGSVTHLGNSGELTEFEKAILHFKVGEKGFFILPNSSFAVYKSGDSAYFYVEILGHNKPFNSDIRTDSIPKKDSIGFVMTDPMQDNFGDTLFTSAKLIKTPTSIVSCGHFDVTQVFEFELSWFNNGVQHKKILVYIHCPDLYGKDYFVVGKSYIITAIPLTDKMKKELNAVDQFPNETVERYYLLRIK